PLNLPEFIVGYPLETANRIVYAEATHNGSILELKEDKAPNAMLYKVQLGNLSQIAAASSIKLGFIAYAHSVMENPKTGEYTVTIPDFPLFEVPVDVVNATIEFPGRPDITSYPDGYEEGGLVGGAFGEITKLNLIKRDVAPETTRMSTIKFSYDPGGGKIQLIYSNISRSYHLGLDGGVHVVDDITLVNKGSEEVSTADKIKYHFPGASSGFKAQTLLGRGVDVRNLGDFVEFSPPYSLKGGQRFNVLLEYDIADTFRPLGWLAFNQKFDITVKAHVPYLVDNFKVKVFSPNGRLLESHLFKNTSRLHEYNLSGEASFTILEVTKNVFRPTLFVIIVASIFFMGFRVAPHLLKREIPEEMREYLTLVSEEIEWLRKLIALEEAHERREIRSKAYAREKTGLSGKLRELSSKVHRLSQSLTKIEDQLEEGERDLIEKKRKLDEALSQLRALESDFSKRKISPDQYRERKKELKRLIDSYLWSLEVEISMRLG
ncbi:MAG: hypothetical protein ACE5GD_11110, partial [Candidatus Geothermarchaeales archaeon]